MIKYSLFNCKGDLLYDRNFCFINYSNAFSGKILQKISKDSIGNSNSHNYILLCDFIS